MTLGLVCDQCHTLSVPTASKCSGCGASLGNFSISTDRPATVDRAGSAKASDVTTNSPGGSAHPMVGPRVCAACGTTAAPTHKFCGECGARLPDEPMPMLAESFSPGRTQFFGVMQAPGRAKLILIRGDGMDGVSYHLAGTEHIAGRLEGQILFPEDRLLSPRHANLYYRNGQLFVRDESSHNGVYVRIRSSITVPTGTSFLVGEQLLRIEACPADVPAQPDAHGTYFYGSPKRPARMQLVQVLVGGEVGMVFRARTSVISIGREGNDVNFPTDPFVSGRHATVTYLDNDRFELTDLGSRNGTFLRVHGETQLQHSDYIFIGQQLLRVEIT